MLIRFSGNTDVGLVRQGNEDAFKIIVLDLLTGGVVDTVQGRQEILEGRTAGLFVVADGMGGAAAGEIASELAVSAVEKTLKSSRIPLETEQGIISYLKSIVETGHSDILKYAKANPRSMGMGTTINIGLVYNDKVYLVWSGDSRCYRYTPHGVQQFKSYDSEHLEILTPDHSEVWEMVEKGQLTAEEARTHQRSNIITKSLGDPTVSPNPDFRIIDLYQDDKLLFCSDGLNGMMADFYIGQILGSPLDIGQTVHTLNEAAKAGGGADNITVIVVEVAKGKAPAFVSALSSSSVITQKVVEPSIIEENRVDKEENTSSTQVNGSKKKEQQESDTRTEIRPQTSKYQPLLLTVLTILLIVAAIYGLMQWQGQEESGGVKPSDPPPTEQPGTNRGSPDGEDDQPDNEEDVTDTDPVAPEPNQPDSEEPPITRPEEPKNDQNNETEIQEEEVVVASKEESRSSNTEEIEEQSDESQNTAKGAVISLDEILERIRIGSDGVKDKSDSLKRQVEGLDSIVQKNPDFSKDEIFNEINSIVGIKSDFDRKSNNINYHASKKILFDKKKDYEAIQNRITSLEKSIQTVENVIATIKKEHSNLYGEQVNINGKREAITVKIEEIQGTLIDLKKITAKMKTDLSEIKKE